MIRWWIGLWNRREDPLALALVRVLLPLVLVADFAEVLDLGLSVPLFGPVEIGGMADPMGRSHVPMLYQLFPATAQTARGAVVAVLVLSAMVSVGLWTRLAAVALLLLLAQLALVSPPADRGIDMLIRNALLLLALSRAGSAWSVDARLRTGRWGGDGVPVPSWPRYLLVLQLVVLYFTAGVQKVSRLWLPMGDWGALYVAMRDPAFAEGWLPWSDALFPFTRLATVSTWLWEWSAPLVLLAYWWRDTSERPGRVRAWVNRQHLLAWWIAVGAFFHVGTDLTLRLGIFPYACMALYPAWFHPDEIRRAAAVVRARAIGAPR